MEGIPNPRQFATVWFETIVQWILSLGGMGAHAYIPMDEVLERTLRWLQMAGRVQVTAAQAEQALTAWRAPPAYPDADAFFRGMNDAGIPTAILSNGTQEMLASAARASGWFGLIDHMLSVERVPGY